MTWKERLLEERDQLSARYDKLLKFRDSDEFDALNFADRVLLEDQAYYMGEYLDVLNERI